MQTDTPSQERDDITDVLALAAASAISDEESCDDDAYLTVMDAERALKEITRLRKELEAAREALTDIAVYGCGMLNQPAAMNGPEEAWLRKRISEYERVARAALGEGQ